MSWLILILGCVHKSYWLAPHTRSIVCLSCWHLKLITLFQSDLQQRSHYDAFLCQLHRKKGVLLLLRLSTAFLSSSQSR